MKSGAYITVVLMVVVKLGLASAPKTALPSSTSTGERDIKYKAVMVALSLVGKPYVYGAAGPDAFDCSGLVQWVYKQLGVETTRTTYTQLEALKTITVDQLQTGDLIYFQFPWDQHVVMVFLDEKGEWSAVQASSPETGVIVTRDIFNDPFYTNAIIGYRSAL